MVNGEHMASCARTIATASALSAAVAALLSPIPLADEIALMPLYAALAARLARIHRVPLRHVPWGALAATTWNGLVARAAANLAFNLLPLLAAGVNATTATVLTVSLGRYFDRALAHPEVAPDVIGFREPHDELRRTIARANGAG